MVPSPPSSLNMNRSASAARSGRAELNEKLHEHTSSSPVLTAGDVDADWEAAESVGGVEYYLMEQEGSRFSEFETAQRCLDTWKKMRASA